MFSQYLRGMIDQQTRVEVDATILLCVLPKLYEIVNDLLAARETSALPKHLVIRARGILPKQYQQSFEGQALKKSGGAP